jgi:hypothetical protein
VNDETVNDESVNNDAARDEELQKLWQQQSLREPALSARQLVPAMHSKTTLLRRCLAARDLRELLACGVVVIVFGYFYFTVYRSPVSRLGVYVILGGAILVAWKLIHARRMTPPAPPGASLVESLRAELNAVRTQSQLLKSVLWWYLLPLTIGALIATWGLSIPWQSKMSVALIFIALDGFVYWLNQRGRAKQLLPLEAELTALLHSAETGEPLDQAQVASLRPLAISLAAAGQVKPVEFKVAFWQIALWGEVGFMGIWFFGMLVPYAIVRLIAMVDPEALADGDVPQFFHSPHVGWIVPFFLGGLVYSWLLQRLTVRAVGISTLGIHLNKGQTLVLWDEIQEVRPFQVFNIRSLWLIKESGEKTLMPWTGLERHADLQAAVERCAPADHPIRQYLKLLK